MRNGMPARQNSVAFYLAHLLSAFGYEFTFFMMTLHIYGQKGSASDVAVFSTITFLPRLFAPLLGSLVDRFPQEKLFAVTLALGAGFTALVPFTRWELIPWTCIAILSVLFGIVRTTLMTLVLADRGYLKGNSAMLLSLNAARLGAPLAGAVAAACLPFRVSLLCAGAIFLVAALFARSVKANAPSKEQTKNREKFLGGLVKGFSELWRSDDLRFLFLLAMIWRLFLGLQISLFIVFVKRGLGGSDSDYGLFMTYLGLGSILGSLAGPWIARRTSSSLFVKLGMGLHFATFIALSCTRTLIIAVPVATAGFAVLYASVVGAHSVRDHAVSGTVRGRVFGANTAVLSVAGMISMLAGGPLADTFGASAVFLAAGALSLLSLFALHLLARPLSAAVQPEA